MRLRFPVAPAPETCIRSSPSPSSAPSHLPPGLEAKSPPTPRGGGEPSSQPEVENLHAAFRREKDVLGLEVAMYEPIVVRRRKPLGNTEPNLDRLGPRQRGAAQSRSQGLSLEKLEHCIEEIAYRSNVIERDDVGMRQGSNDSCLSLETNGREPRDFRQAAGQRP